MFESGGSEEVDYFRPPDEPLTFNWKVEDVVPLFEEAMAQLDRRNDMIASLTAETATFDNLVSRVDRLTINDTRLQPLAFMHDVHPDAAFREAVGVGKQKYSDHADAQAMRQDVYAAFRHMYDSRPELELEDRWLVDAMNTDFKLSGLHLPEEKRNEIVRLRSLLTAQTIDYNTVLNNDDTEIRFTPDELDGVPPENLAKYGWDGEKYVIRFDAPSFGPLMKYAKKEATRERAWIADQSRVKDNIVRLYDAVGLRAKIASLLGYANFADLATAENMAKGGQEIAGFLADLRTKLTPAADRDVAALTALKHAEAGDGGERRPLMQWDIAYFERALSEQRHKLDFKEVNWYFELEATIRAIHKIFEEVFSLKYVHVPAPWWEIWEPTVDRWAVWKTDTDEFAGWLYYDFFPRPGAATGAAEYRLRAGHIDPVTGKRRYAAAAIKCNFARPTNIYPALMTHGDVLTFLHESGHALHELLSETKYGRFSGTATPIDFVETPSQVMENWGWEPAILKRIGRHYFTKVPISDDMIRALVATRNEHQAINNLKQVFYATFDNKLYTGELGVHANKELQPEKEADSASTAELKQSKAGRMSDFFNDLRLQITKISVGEHEETGRPRSPPGLATFTHIMNGYAGSYYSYLWSHVFSSDIFYSKFAPPPLPPPPPKLDGQGESDGTAKDEKFDAGHLLDPQIGRAYRDTVLKPGWTRNPRDSLREFLGREPNHDAFLRQIGVDVKPRPDVHEHDSA